MSRPRSESPRKDLWIPGCFIAFFVCLAALEIWFVTLANKSFTGVVTDDAYSTGLNYNAMLAQREAERQLGWSASFTFAQGEGLDGQLTLSLRDGEGQHLRASELRATAERMSRFPQIQAVTFSPQAEGEYGARIEVPLAGRWFIRVRIERDGQVMHVIEEVNVRP